MTTPTSTPLVDRVVDERYRVLRHVADGGMASVYVALDTRLDREVALKVMRPDLARDATFVARFRKEARAAARLSHPHAVAVFDQGEDDGLIFLAMELIRGRTLRELLRDNGPLAPRQALAICADILGALAAAHAAGVVHRDVKPENVLIGDDGLVKVADFGLARAISSTTSSVNGAFGTLAYLAPEQATSGSADARADVYATALVLHEMLTGSPAVTGDSPIHVAYQHVQGDLPAPSDRVDELPAALDDLVAAGSRLDPQERPADAGAYLARLLAARDALSDAELDRVPTPIEATANADTRTGRIHRPTRALPLPPDRTGRTAPQATAPADAGTPGSPRPRPRLTRRALIAATVAALGVTLLAVWAFVVGPLSLRPVPALGGQQQAAAVQALEEAGLRPTVSEAFSETAAKGTVVGTTPGEGTQVRGFTQVSVAISKGPERYEVPDLAGGEVADAPAALADNHLKLAGTKEAWHEKVPRGKVVGTTPTAGSEVKPGTAVTIVVSKGREPIELIDWTGKPFSEARDALTAKGVTVVRDPEEKYDSTVPKGGILRQDPSPTTVHRGDKVTFVVSKGPEMVDVPLLRGRSEGEAQRILEAAGFRTTVNRIAGGILGIVQSTDPGPGQAPRGSTIRLNVV